MKRLVPLLVAAAAFLGLCALASAQDDLQQKLDKKLASPFLKKAEWQTDYDKACKAAKDGNKLVFAYFTRSYAT